MLDRRSSKAVYPPGETKFSLKTTKRMLDEPGELLLECYERFGPVFTVRLFTNPTVFLLGPQANHYMTVSHASNFTIRESLFRDLIPIVGNGVLTVDGELHREMRHTVQPAFHSKSISSYFDVMCEETEDALDAIGSGVVDVNAWVRRLVLRISLRALFGLDPDGESVRRSTMVQTFEEDLAASALLRLPGPFSAWGRFKRNLAKLDQVIYEEIAARRAGGAEGTDVFSLLLKTCHEDGEPLTDVEVRDQMLTLLLASLDTTASTISFMLFELARHPEAAERVLAEQQAARLEGELGVEQFTGRQLPELEMVLEETLRLYPATWIGPRRAEESFELHGVTVPAGAYVNYSPLASHRLPDVFPEPNSFKPERFAPEAKAALPKGAYVPFGAGSRICIGMRFAQLAARTVATLALEQLELSPVEGFSLETRPRPMLKPRKGVPIQVAQRARRSELALAG